MQLEKMEGIKIKKHLDLSLSPPTLWSYTSVSHWSISTRNGGAWVMHSVGQKTDAERIKEAGKQMNKMTSLGAHAYLQGLLWDLHEINLKSTQAK